MRKEPTILRLVLATGMLLIFLFSITPKLYLHELFAGHKDSVSKTANDGVTVSQDGFNCDYHSLVATSPFTEVTDKISTTCLPTYSYLFNDFLTVVHTRTPHFTELRGPPSLG